RLVPGDEAFQQLAVSHPCERPHAPEHLDRLQGWSGAAVGHDRGSPSRLFLLYTLPDSVVSLETFPKTMGGSPSDRQDVRARSPLIPPLSPVWWGVIRWETSLSGPPRPGAARGRCDRASPSTPPPLPELGPRVKPPRTGVNRRDLLRLRRLQAGMAAGQEP